MLPLKDFLEPQQTAIIETRRANPDKQKRNALFKALAEIVKLSDAADEDITALIRKLHMLRNRR